MTNTTTDLKTQDSTPQGKVKHILKALGVGVVSTLWLLAQPDAAQAASFVTTFDTHEGDLTLEWSGSDSDLDGTISSDELSGPVFFSVPPNGRYDLGSPDSWDLTSSFSYDTGSDLLDLSNLTVGPAGVQLTAAPYLTTATLMSFDFLGLSTFVYSQNTVVTSPLDGDEGHRARESEATPEPTLTLGLITLGGLMLGSRKKEKA